jgi:tRNA pseudouridine32 synthase/23S rRNA pseudouridine746 synthase/23S rRNA pseudouridine1911/1915/1917 synthase
LRKLHRLFSEGRVEKTYWAVTQGVPEKLSGTVDAPLKKETRGAGWRVVIAADGQHAVTTYRVIAQRDGLAFIEAKPKTGRTHQIRVHLAFLGAPILGDPQYGELSAEDRAQPMMLHARRVVVPISANKDPVAVEAPPPAAMAAIIDRLRG